MMMLTAMMMMMMIMMMRNDQVRAHGQWGETKRCLPLKIR